jgi:hypothetical protein
MRESDILEIGSVISYYLSTEKIMNIVKLILIALGLFTVIFLAYFLIGIVSTLLWYGFVLGVIGAIGYGGYKLYKKSDAPQIEGKQTVSISEMDKADRTLEEYKSKYLPK